MPSLMPPLNALKAFEAAARTGGFVLAARELRVSPSAVSQQVKNLEHYFDKKLFVRHNNRITLTDAGLAIFSEASEALRQLAGLTARVMEDDVRSRLVVSVLPSLAVKWLNGHLPDFLHDEESIRIDVRIEEDPIDFARRGVDVRICYGRHLYPDLICTPLLQDEVVPMCSPQFVERLGLADYMPSDLAEGDLIHTDWGSSFASLPSWTDWFERVGLPGPADLGRGHRVGMSSLAIDLASRGLGVALGQRLLAERELADHRLVVPFGPALEIGHTYCAVHHPSKAHRADVNRFVRWLVGVARRP